MIVIPEIRVEGKPLGRHEHEYTAEDLKNTAPQAQTIISVQHASQGLPLNQGQIGSCTANALVGAVNSLPDYIAPFGPVRTESDAQTLYSLESKNEGQPWPPNDPGGTGPLVCQAAQSLGWIYGYSIAVGLHAALQALVLRPVITGIEWYDSFDSPSSAGLIEITPGATVRGGHEILVDGIDVTNNVVWCWNSWGSTWGQGGKFCMSWSTWNTLLNQGGDVTVPLAGAGQ